MDARLYKRLHNIKPGTNRNYGALERRLREFAQSRGQQDFSFEEITIDWYWAFQKYLYANQIGPAGFGKHVKFLKKFMREGLERGFHHNTDFQKKNFLQIQVFAENKTFLSLEEIARIESLDFAFQNNLRLERDRFLISYYFLLRFSDVQAVRPENFIRAEGKDYFRYTSQKTGIECTLPVGSAARAILERYHYAFPASSNQDANRKLKTIAAAAGITGRAPSGKWKWEEVTTHTARRSAATNLYLAGAGIKLIAQLGGWVKLDTLRRYLLASGIDAAKVAGELDFFR